MLLEKATLKHRRTISGRKVVQWEGKKFKKKAHHSKNNIFDEP